MGRKTEHTERKVGKGRIERKDYDRQQSKEERF